MAWLAWVAVGSWGLARLAVQAELGRGAFALGLVLAGLLFAKFFHRRNYKTIIDFFETRYGKSLARAMKKMGREMGEDLPPEFDEVTDGKFELVGKDAHRRWVRAFFERYEVRVRGRDEQLVLVDRHVALGEWVTAFSDELRRQIALVFPNEIAVGGIAPDAFKHGAQRGQHEHGHRSAAGE